MTDRSKLTVRILSFDVDIVVKPAGTLTLGGKLVNALTDADNRVIYLDATLPRCARLNVLLSRVHGYARFYVVQPGDAEFEAEEFAFLAEGVFTSLAAQGGAEALMALEPADDVASAPGDGRAQVAVGARIIDVRAGRFGIVFEVRPEGVFARFDPPPLTGPRTFLARYDEFAVEPADPSRQDGGIHG